MLFRSTVNNFEKHKADGCISVEMECAALQAMCDFRGLELYMFFTSGDLLDAPQWEERRREGDDRGTQHDAGQFDIALELARYVTCGQGENGYRERITCLVQGGSELQWILLKKDI